MNKYKFIGIIFCVLFFYTTFGIIERFNIYEKGEIVKVIVTDKNEGGGLLGSYWINFKYRGKDFSRQLGVAYYNEIKVGQELELKHIKGSKYFMFVTENPKVRLILNSFLLLIGLFFLLFKFKKK